MKRILLLLPVLFMSCESDDRANSEHAAYCKYYDGTVASLTSSAVYQTDRSKQLILATAAIDYIETHHFDVGRGRFCDEHSAQVEMLHRLVDASLPKPITAAQPPPRQELKQGEAGHPVAGAAIGAGAAWLLLGGPIGVGLGAIAGAVVGSHH